MDPFVRYIPAAQAKPDERSQFLVRTYAHLVGAIFAFVAVEFLLFASGFAQAFANSLFSGALAGRFGWLIILGGFMGVGYVAEKWARSGGSQGKQYAGLGLYILGQSIIMVPLLYMAAFYTTASVIPTAAVTTLVLFGGLTAVVFITRKDFSFLRTGLMFAGFAAMGLIVVSVLFGFSLGTFFAWGMLALSGGYTLYYTSNVLHHYRTDQHVAASLSLFANIALMFYYVLMILMSQNRR